ncbi:MAG: OmpA family protein, partial [Hyphomicrobiaceae bacterium]
LKALLAERESWGTEPSKGRGSGGGYAVLPTTSTADLIAARETWGMGKAKKVAAPLAAGAKSPLPSDNFKVPKGSQGETTVHPLEASPVAQMTPVPGGQISDALKALLAERESWGTEPSKGGTPAAAVPRSAEAADCEAKLRDAASKGVILFASSSANLRAKSNATLNQLAKVAKGCSKGRIRVEGHTDSTGRASFNKRLSERRAQAVAAYLTKAGVAKDRVEAVGYGQEKPVASNNTADGRAKNRRIEFTVVE